MSVLGSILGAVLGTGLGVGAEELTKKDASVKPMSTLDAHQGLLRNIMLSNLLGIPASEGVSATNIAHLINSGYFDESSLFPGNQVYGGDRVAGLTGAQSNILNQNQNLAAGITQQGLPSNVSSGINSIFARRGFEGPTNPLVAMQTPPSQTVGETPETITANQDVVVTPQTSSEKYSSPDPKTWLDRAPDWWTHVMQPVANQLQKNYQITGQEVPAYHKALLNRLGMDIPNNPLAQENNQQGQQPQELLNQTGLPGYAQGGVLPAGQSAVVGENGPEQITPLNSNIQNATNQALSGTPSTTINTGTTNDFIQKAIADPSRKNFNENTLQQIKASFAGPGYWGSSRAKAEMKGAQDVESNIASLGAQYKYADEQAKRELAENAANRSLSAVPTALNVSNNPLVQGQMQANIGQTKANIGLTKANIGQIQANIQQTLANVGLTQANTDRISGLIQQDLAQTGQISANTISTLQQMGVTDAQIENIKSQTARSDMSLYQQEQDYQLQKQNVITAQLNNLGKAMSLAGLEQSQNQAGINAEIQKFNEENQAAWSIWNELMNMLGMTTQAAVVTPGTEGIGSGIASSVMPLLGDMFTQNPSATTTSANLNNSGAFSGYHQP